MKYPNILKAAGGTEILAAINGLPVNDGNFILSEAQMTAVEARLGEADTAITAAADQAEALTTAQAALATAQTELTAATESLATANTEIATLKAKVAELEAAPAATPRSSSKAKDEIPSGEVPFHASADNPMNRIADQMLGVPAEKAPADK